jgi:hypothetical protein
MAAMDLYNNRLGRQIAVDNPHASPEELQLLIREKIDSRQAIVINHDKQIEWSNRVKVGDTISPDPAAVPLPAAN